ncbi:hypothetical protein LINPERHAP1_LOCUS13866 [Linum perenne]
MDQRGRPKHPVLSSLCPTLA